MSAAEPTPSPIPHRPAPRTPNQGSKPQNPINGKHDEQENSRPYHKPSFPTPKLRLQVADLTHPGSTIFLRNCIASTALSSAVDSVLSILYIPMKINVHIPGTRSVTVILEPMDGVAYTTGMALDNDHKEIHFSLDYINHVADDRKAHEIQGVLVHEMVHCWQWNAKGTCPGGLIEGIADYVRLKAGLDPPHWKRPTKKKAKEGKEEGDVDKGDQKWDAGYEKTGFFLEWLEDTYGEGNVRNINEMLRDHAYDEKRFWRDLFGENVDELWKRYVDTWKEEVDER